MLTCHYPLAFGISTNTNTKSVPMNMGGEPFASPVAPRRRPLQRVTRVAPLIGRLMDSKSMTSPAWTRKLIRSSNTRFGNLSEPLLQHTTVLPPRFPRCLRTKISISPSPGRAGTPMTSQRASGTELCRLRKELKVRNCSPRQLVEPPPARGNECYCFSFEKTGIKQPSREGIKQMGSRSNDLNRSALLLTNLEVSLRPMICLNAASSLAFHSNMSSTMIPE